MRFHQKKAAEKKLCHLWLPAARTGTDLTKVEERDAFYSKILHDILKEEAEITEFYMPKDCPAFCAGCTNCILKGEHTCKVRGKRYKA